MLLLNMRIPFINIFLVFCIFLFVSCKGKPDKNDTVLEVTKSNYADTIHIDLDTISTRFSFKDLFSHIEIIPLQTTMKSFMCSPQKVIVNEENINRYVLLDRFELSLFSFDSVGNFIRKSPLKNIEKILYRDYIIGHGRIGGNFVFNPFDSTYMYFFNSKISMYNHKTLKYIRKEKINLDSLDAFAPALIPLDKDIYVFHAGYVISQEDSGDDIYFYSISGDSLVKTVNFHRKLYWGFRNSPFSTYAGRFFFLSPFLTNTIYEIHPDSLSVEPFLTVDYGENTLNEDNFDSIIHSSDRKFSYLIDMFQNSKSYWFFSCIEGDKDIKYFFSVYDKATKAIQTVDAGILAYKTILLTDEILYCSVKAEDAQKILDLGILTEENANRLVKVKENDNPVILKCYLNNKDQ